MELSLITPADIKYSYRGTEQLIYEYARLLREKGINATLLIAENHILTPHHSIPLKLRADWDEIRPLYSKIPKKHIPAFKIVFPFGYSPIVYYKNLPKASLVYLSENVHSYFLNILLKPHNQTYVIGTIGMLMRSTRNPIKYIVNKILDFMLFKMLFVKKGIRDKIYYHVISSAQKTYLMRMGIQEERIFHIVPLINTESFTPKYFNSSKKLNIVHIGGIDKSASMVISIIKHLRESKKLDLFEFYFIGRQQPDELKYLTEKYSNIHSLGRIEDIEKIRLFSKMDVVIAPDYEGYSMAMVEGLASGLYVLASAKNPGAMDVKNRGAKIYLANEAAEHAKNLEELVKNKRNRKSFNKGRLVNIRVSKDYNSESVITLMKKMFEKAESST